VAFHEALLGNTDEAIRQQRIVEQLLASVPDDRVFDTAPMAVYTYGRLGRPDDARRMFDTYMLGMPVDRSSPTVLASLGLGDVDRAYKHATALAEQPRQSPAPSCGSC
jgi:hypothetical protein